MSTVDREERIGRLKVSTFKAMISMSAVCLLSYLLVQSGSLWLSQRKIAYPVDILLESPAPLYQADFQLEDAHFSSKFESGNLRTVV
jgi:hypothetical protein